MTSIPLFGKRKLLTAWRAELLHATSVHVQHPSQRYNSCSYLGLILGSKWCGPLTLCLFTPAEEKKRFPSDPLVWCSPLFPLDDIHRAPSFPGCGQRTAVQLRVCGPCLVPVGTGLLTVPLPKDFQWQKRRQLTLSPLCIQPGMGFAFALLTLRSV